MTQNSTNKNNGAFTDSIGGFFVEAYNTETDSLTFSYIAQTEGVHTDVSGKTIEYTPNLMLNAAPSFIGTALSYDPKHEMKRSGMENERPTVADVLDSELIRLNEDAIKKYSLNPSLLGRYGLKNKAVGKDLKFNSNIRDGKLPYHSSEFQFTGSQDNDGIYHPDQIKYTGGILLETEGADPGSVLMDIYNTKYGGNKMSDDDNQVTKENLEKAQADTATATKAAEDATKVVEETKEEVVNAKKELDAKTAENTALQEKVKILEEAANSSPDPTTEEKIQKMSETLEVSNAKLATYEKSMEISNAKVKELVNEKRVTILNEVVANADFVKKVIDEDLDDESFNARIAEIIALKEEGKEEGQKELVNNDVGVAHPLSAANANKEFETEWGMSQDEFMEKELGVKLE